MNSIIMLNYLNILYATNCIEKKENSKKSPKFIVKKKKKFIKKSKKVIVKKSKKVIVKKSKKR